MKFANIFDRVYGLYLDERVSNYDQINKIIPHEKFVGGKGNLLPIEEYNHIDTEDLPPVYLNSTNYPTWHNRNSAYNAWLCHQKIFRKFYDDPSKPQTLMLLEDDIEFMEGYENILPLIEETVKSYDWDMFYFGCYQNGKSEPTKNPNIRIMHGGGGLHACAMKRHIVEELLSYVAIGPYDEISGRYLHQKYKCLAVFPTIINQVSGFSYVEGHHLTKPSFWEV